MPDINILGMIVSWLLMSGAFVWLIFCYVNYQPLWLYDTSWLRIIILVPYGLTLMAIFMALTYDETSRLRLITFIVIYEAIACLWATTIWWYYRYRIYLSYQVYKPIVERDIIRDSVESKHTRKWLSIHDRHYVLNQAGRTEADRRMRVLLNTVSFPEHWYHHILQLIFLGICWPINFTDLLLSRMVYQTLRKFFVQPEPLAQRLLPSLTGTSSEPIIAIPDPTKHTTRTTNPLLSNSSTL